MTTLNCPSSLFKCSTNNSEQKCLQLERLFENVRDGQEEEQMGRGRGEIVRPHSGFPSSFRTSASASAMLTICSAKYSTNNVDKSSSTEIEKPDKKVVQKLRVGISSDTRVLTTTFT